MFGLDELQRYTPASISATAFSFRLHLILSNASLTFSPRGPLRPFPASNVTACPSRSWSNEVCWQADWWKKYAGPSPGDEPEPFVANEPFDRAVW